MRSGVQCFLRCELRRARSSASISKMRLAFVFLALSYVALVPCTATAKSRVAVQPFGGSDTEPMRRQVAGIVGRHGFRVLTSLAAVSGTSQYPGLAKSKKLAAFIVADVTERGTRTSVTFLVWQGIDGNVIARWETSGPKKTFARKLAKDFWKHLGPSIQKAKAPPSDYLPPAPPMRINAGTPIADSANPS